MISFILNNQLITTDRAFGVSLLDFIRYDEDLPGTKIGCREGDCGACTVLEGTLVDGKMQYKSIVSCLTPLGNAHGKHIVTIEGINMGHLSPVQKAFVDNAATQCGFCTPGFVMSLTAHSLSKEKSTKKSAIASVSGNICRCTGYKSIEKAAEEITTILKDKDIKDPIGWLVENNHLPAYFLGIGTRLNKIDAAKSTNNLNNTIIAGGTDLMAQRPEELAESEVELFQHRAELKGIRVENGKCIIGAATTASDLMQSSIIQEVIPDMATYFKLVSSEPIRNMGTIAGNIVNASPIGDLSIMFLALNAEVILNDRIVPLKDFFIGYKKLNINKGEYVKSICFAIPTKISLFNFEKVSKRTHLDIASVNSAIQIRLDGDKILECSLSIGGVSPIPLYLAKTSEYLKGKTVSKTTILETNRILQEEISPISDVRGSEDYKRLLARQLFFGHFIKLFSNRINLSDLL
ncbi:MAG: 2Fe-2S iron-sulfur cluster binding domain-containing protein [Bacteroidales bacterium]|nr:2Fe-2S iron-sulfur cluster binding domain-containing protein [Bacteroidales bacterium]